VEDVAPSPPASAADASAETHGFALWWPVLAYCVLILSLSSIPASAMPDIRVIWRNDKVIHACEYAGLGGLLALCIVRRWRRLAPVVTCALALFCAALFGASDELYQGLIPGRSSSPWDFLADATGALVGATLVTAFWIRSGRAGSTRSD